MNQIKLLLMGVIVTGIMILGAGVYLRVNKNPVQPLAPNEQISQSNSVAASRVEINQSPINIIKEINIPMANPWTDTNISVKSGQSIRISATGRGVWKNISPSNPNAVPTPYEECSPEGTNPNARDYWSNIHQYQMRANKGALIGKIGVNGLPFKVGSNFNQIISESGVLYLGVNDMRQELDPTSYNDNSGGFQARIEIK